MVKADIKEIREALKIAGKVVNRKSSMPILRHVLLCTEYNGRGLNLRLTATDLENTLIFRIPLEGKTRIPEIVVDYDALAKACRAAGKRREIEFDYQDDIFAAVIGRGRYPFDNKLKADDFLRTPPIDSFEAQGGGAFPADALHSGLAKVAPAMSDDEMRRSLRGVFFDAARQRLVATDGHRLHYVPFELAGFSDSLLTKTALPALFDLLKITDGDALVVRRGNFLLFTPARYRTGTADYRFISRVVDAEFPDYPQVVPAKDRIKYRFDVDTSELAESCERMAKLGHLHQVYSAGGSGVKLTVNGALEIADKGKAREVITTHGDHVNPELEVGINIKFLTDLIKHAGDKIRVSMRGIKNPVKWDTDGLSVVIMPFDLK